MALSSDGRKKYTIYFFVSVVLGALVGVIGYFLSDNVDGNTFGKATPKYMGQLRGPGLVPTYRLSRSMSRPAMYSQPYGKIGASWQFDLSGSRTAAAIVPCRRSHGLVMCDKSIGSLPTTAEDTSMPPNSFKTLLADAAASTDAAIADGSRLMEVEFPPFPASKLEDTSISASDILAQNLQLVFEFIKQLSPDETTGAPRKIALTFTDPFERRSAREFFGSAEPWPGLFLYSVDGADADSETGFNPMAFFGVAFKQLAKEVVPAEWASMYIFVSASSQELPSIQKLAELEPNKPIVCFNLKLETAKGDLGLPAFPGRSLHHDFLCKIKPVYYLRPASFTLSLPEAPFSLPFGGVLFRRYPEGYQSLLNRGSAKSYRRINLQAERPSKGTFESQLLLALKLDDEKAAASAITQAGNTASPWWDNADDRDVSRDWKL